MKNIFRRSKKEKLKTNNCMKEVDIKIFKMVKERGLNFSPQFLLLDF